MISVECHAELPFEYESYLIERYCSFTNTCHYIATYYPNFEINYMSVKKDEKLVDILIFGIKGNTCTCFNSLAYIDQEIMSEFTKSVFVLFPAIRKIGIKASYSSYEFDKSITLPKSEDYILKLPKTLDDYNSQLGTKTRKHLKARIAKLQKEFSTVNFVLSYGPEIQKTVIDKIVQFNWDRMKHKGRKSGIDELYKDNMFKFAEHYGCVAYLELDGNIVAGSITTVLNKELFFHVIAHDNDFSKFNVGEVCAYHLIESSINKELETMHFLWGKSEMKRRFQAEPQPLYSYLVFRKYSLDFLICKFKNDVLELLIRIKHSGLYSKLMALKKK